MTYQEKQSITSLVAMTIGTVAYLAYANDQKYQSIDTNNAPELAWALLVFVIFQVVVLIVGHIILAITESIRREYRNHPIKKDFDKLDEREKALDSRSDRLSGNVYMAAVFIGVILVALENDTRTLFLAIGIGGLLSGYVSEFLKLFLSRRVR